MSTTEERMQKLIHGLVRMHFVLLDKCVPDPPPEIQIPMMQEIIRVATEAMRRSKDGS